MKSFLTVLIISFLSFGGFYLYKNSTNSKDTTPKTTQIVPKVIICSQDGVKKSLDQMEYLKKQKERLKKIGAEIYIVTKEDEEMDGGGGYCYRAGMKELVFTKEMVPIQNLCPGDREYFKDVIEEEVGVGCTKDEILKAIPGIKEEDFKDCGELRDSIDWQIFLNNILQRLGYQPRGGEDLDSIIKMELLNRDK